MAEVLPLIPAAPAGTCGRRAGYEKLSEIYDWVDASTDEPRAIPRSLLVVSGF